MSDISVAIDMNIDWQSGMVTFTEQALGGLVTINPPTVTVPLLFIMRIASEAIYQSLPPQIQQFNFTPPKPPNTRGGKSIAFDATVGGKT